MIRNTFITIIFTLIISGLHAQYTGMGTYFEGLGVPYGGCGVPQNVLETQYFVALNVYNTPGDATEYPIPVTDQNITGEFNNGKNCGRWIKVTIGADCNGTNDGALGQEFCRGANAQWVEDWYTGAELYMIVADACPDGNAWCRDSRYHLDLSEASVNQFKKDGQPVGDLIPDNWNNRELHWEYVSAPNYSGDIQIHFMQNAQIWWPAILITHLANGIHSVEQLVNGNWIPTERNETMGQSFILEGGSTEFTIRVYDVNDELINNGREYTFSLPSSCGGACPSPTTEISYTTFDPNPTPSQTIAVERGWNLVSLYIDVPNTAISELFPSIRALKDYDQFYYYNQPNLYNSTTEITIGNGYLLYFIRPTELTFEGSLLSPRTFELTTGWNLIGGPIADAIETGTALAQISSSWIEIKDFDSFKDVSGSGSLNILQPGKAYFVKVAEDCTLTW